MSEEIQSNLEIVVFALHCLGGVTRKVPTENIAHDAFLRSPNRFSWVSKQFRQFPDKEVARLALEDAAKRKNGSLVKGKYARDVSKDGWILTPEGSHWLESNINRISKSLSVSKETLPGLSPTEVKRFKSRLSRERAFQTYRETGKIESVSRFMFTDMLQVSPDANSEILSTKFNRMLSLARLIKDETIIRFLDECREHFREFL
jgi:hypothetical protein